MSKKCGTCFRYCENWRDARAKGLQERHTGLFDYHYKPREGVKPHCIGGKVRDGLHEKHPACEYHKYRWLWNFKTLVLAFQTAADGSLQEVYTCTDRQIT